MALPAPASARTSVPIHSKWAVLKNSRTAESSQPVTIRSRPSASTTSSASTECCSAERQARRARPASDARDGACTHGVSPEHLHTLARPRIPCAQGAVGGRGVQQLRSRCVSRASAAGKALPYRQAGVPLQSRDDVLVGHDVPHLRTPHGSAHAATGAPPASPTAKVLVSHTFTLPSMPTVATQGRAAQNPTLADVRSA